MSDKLEEIMKKIHVYFANCQESPYSEKDLIVSKERIFALLEELNYAVYDAMEAYELTKSAREKALAQVERQADDIKAKAMQRSEEIHAASLLNTQQSISETKRALKNMQEKVRVEYEALLTNYEEKISCLEKNSLEIISQLETMNDAKYYLHLIEDTKKKYEKLEQLEEQQEEEQEVQIVTSKNVGTVGGSVASFDGYEEPLDEFESKLSDSIVVAVHDAPKVPTGFKKSKKKKKGKMNIEEQLQISSQELDAEYFAFQEEQQALSGQGTMEVEKEEKGIFRKLGFGNKKE